MENLLNKVMSTPKYPPKNWTAKKAIAYGYEFTQDAASTTITGLTDRKAFIGNKIIPDNIDNKPVIRIGNYVFCNCIGLNSITISNLVTNIGYAAFNSCTRLTSITIPSSVTNISNNAFSYCPELTSIISNSPNYRVEEHRYLIQNSNNLLITFAQKGATTAVIPKSVVNIGNYIFYKCTELTSINIPESVINIGDSVFKDCTGLTNIVIPSSVTDIGEWTFSHCTELTNIKIAKPVNSIDGAPWDASKAKVKWNYKG